MIILWIVASFLYLTVAGAIYGPVLRQRKSVCRYKDKGTCDGEDGHEVLAALTGLLWLISLPMIIGHKVGTKVVPADGLSFTDRRRANEIEEAEHKFNIAKINAKTLAMQERELGIGER